MEEKDTLKEKEKALQLALTGIEKQFGKGSIMKLGDAAAKINFTAPFTMVGAYAGLAIGDQLKTFVKQGPKILLVGLLVMTGTFLGSCIWDSLILKLTGAI